MRTLQLHRVLDKILHLRYSAGFWICFDFRIFFTIDIWQRLCKNTFSVADFKDTRLFIIIRKPPALWKSQIKGLEALGHKGIEAFRLEALMDFKKLIRLLLPQLFYDWFLLNLSLQMMFEQKAIDGDCVNKRKTNLVSRYQIKILY